MEYNLKYTKIKPSVVKAVRDVILKDRIFKANESKRAILLFLLNRKLCNLYNINESDIPRLKQDNNTTGYYNNIENIICLNDKLSLITFLHEFKHFLQHINNKTNNENIARGFSLSLFYQSSPRHFKRALEKGLILHQKI